MVLTKSGIFGDISLSILGSPEDNSGTNLIILFCLKVIVPLSLNSELMLCKFSLQQEISAVKLNNYKIKIIYL